MGTSRKAQKNEAAGRTQTARRPHRRILAALLATVLAFAGAAGITAATPSQAFAGGAGSAPGVPMLYRLYNLNTSEHFYTDSYNELATLSDNGWTYEGNAWASPGASNTPVYRLYNPNTGDHHYTTDENEKNGLTAVGWTYEGIGWQALDDTSG